MKMEESEKIVLVGCIIDFDDNQVWLNQFNNVNLILNDCKVMKAFFILAYSRE